LISSHQSPTIAPISIAGNSTGILIILPIRFNKFKLKITKKNKNLKKERNLKGKEDIGVASFSIFLLPDGLLKKRRSS
jgi:hypothetical protein